MVVNIRTHLPTSRTRPTYFAKTITYTKVKIKAPFPHLSVSIGLMGMISEVNSTWQYFQGWKGTSKFPPPKSIDILCTASKKRAKSFLLEVRTLSKAALSECSLDRLLCAGFQEPLIITQAATIVTLIPHICHESHEYTRVNFFGRCKFLQI